MQQYDFLALRSFIAVIETGNFSRAAELLNALTAANSRSYLLRLCKNVMNAGNSA